MQKANHNSRAKANFVEADIIGRAARLYDVSYNTKLCSDCKQDIESELFTADVADSSVDYLPSSNPSSSQNIQSQVSNFSTEAASDPEMVQHKKSEELKVLDSINDSLGLPPIHHRSLQRNVTYKKSVSEAITKKIDQIIELDRKEESSKTVVAPEVIENIKRGISEASTQKTVELLSVLPQDWSYKDIQDTFSVGRRMVEKVKQYQLTGEHPIRKLRSDAVDEETKKKIEKFYFELGVSRQLSGTRDFVRVESEDGKKEKLQKQVLFHSIEETYNLFTKAHPDIQIGVTTFYLNKPPNVVYSTDKYTKEFCLCVYCHNVERVLESSGLNGNKFRDIVPEGNIRHQARGTMEKLLCPEKTADCYKRSCGGCRDKAQEMKDAIISVCEENDMENLEYEEWTSTDRMRVQTKTKSAEDFANEFVKKLEEFGQHWFVVQEQEKAYKELTKNLPNNTALAVSDFAENYSFFEAREIQSAYYAKDQATLYTMVLFTNKDGEIKQQNIVFISDCTKHTAKEVYCYNSILNDYLKETFPERTHQYYWSDGAPGHFKCRSNFINLAHHEQDYNNVSASWGFSGTAHGKGPWDGLGKFLQQSEILS